MFPVCQTVRPATEVSDAQDTCRLTYEDRFFRRKKLRSERGMDFLVDMEKTTNFDHGDVFELDNGVLVEIVAAPEPCLSVTGPDLARLAWHIGNRHTPCQVEANRLVIRDDPVIAHMLEHLGATIAKIFEPFTPEGGAYGHGRTHSHEHGKTAHHVHGH